MNAGHIPSPQTNGLTLSAKSDNHHQIGCCGFGTSIGIAHLLTGEPLPRPSKRKKAQVDPRFDAEIEYDGVAWLDQGDNLQGEDEEEEDWNPERNVIEVLIAGVGASHGNDRPIGLPTRYLPHSCVAHMYLVYVATQKKWQQDAIDAAADQFANPDPGLQQCVKDLNKGPASQSHFTRRHN